MLTRHGRLLQKIFKSVEPTKLLVLGFFSYTMVGWILLSLPFVSKIQISPLDNLFISVSAITTTGLGTIDIVESYNVLGQIFILMLMQLGALGYMTIGSFIILSMKMRISEVTKTVLQTGFSLPKHLNIFKFVKSIVIYTLLVEILGAILLYFVFKNDDRINPIWSSIFHSISAFCTCGFTLYSNSLESYVNNTKLNTIIAVLSLLGSIGYIVAIDFWLLLRKKTTKLTFTSRIILHITFWLVIVGTIFIFFLEPSIQEKPIFERFQIASFHTISSITTAGFNTIDMKSLSIATLFFTSIYMTIGASPAGTGGGIKSTTLAAILALITSTFRRETKIRFLNRVVSTKKVILASSNFIVYIIILLSSVYIISLIENYSLEELLFECSAALGTAGLSVGLTKTVSPIGKLLLILLMYIGRIGPMNVGISVSKKIKNNNKKIEKIEDLVV